MCPFHQLQEVVLLENDILLAVTPDLDVEHRHAVGEDGVGTQLLQVLDLDGDLRLAVGVLHLPQALLVPQVVLVAPLVAGPGVQRAPSDVGDAGLLRP